MDAYQSALDYIYGPARYHRHGCSAVRYDLSRMRRLLERLGNPHERFQCVHIAGTKGKGSTAALTESVLRAAGHRTGLFTSPHLHTFRERIRLNGALIPKQDLIELLERCKPVLESEPERTTFETITTLAFTYFAEQRVDWAVLEVGLGGRLDATNVVHPAACAITSLSLDHTNVLGHTLSLIAWEKAGIIKPGIPVISAPQAEEAMKVIVDMCRTTGARLETAGPAPTSPDDPTYVWQWTARGEIDLSGQIFTVQGPQGILLEDLPVPFLGRHQLNNACVAVAILCNLRGQGAVIPDAAIYEGMAQARWPGRLEVLAREPWIVVDSAHNVDSAQKLRLALQELFTYRRLGLVFGASRDKDIRGMLEVFLPMAARSVVSASLHPRAADPLDLATLARSILPDAPLSVTYTMEDALDEILAWAEPDDLILVTGSIFAVAAARAVLAERGHARFPADDWVYEADPPPRPVRQQTRGAGV
ncbi:MAG TPA: bifunctional folylpolyglutamate synthase/dihydrofolate synthase [Caldilineae bacterium]|nr:bifunctional folylpolyglutamate synthase/dihydrofolate synthase [Caldilineae bacterium]